MKRLLARIKYQWTVWKYETYDPWFKEHKDNWFFRYLEGASWFKWYGKRVVHVKRKNVSELSDLERDIIESIDAKDYQKALDIAKTLSQTPKIVALIQVIQAKLK